MRLRHCLELEQTVEERMPRDGQHWIYLNAANCGRPIVTKRDPPGMMEGVATYSRCNALRDDYFKSKQLLIDAGARATRVSTPNRPK
jgi:hypothetical protein